MILLLGFLSLETHNQESKTKINGEQEPIVPSNHAVQMVGLQYKNSLHTLHGHPSMTLLSTSREITIKHTLNGTYVCASNRLK
jgi:hypothetical protein